MAACSLSAVVRTRGVETAFAVLAVAQTTIVVTRFIRFVIERVATVGVMKPAVEPTGPLPFAERLGAVVVQPIVTVSVPMKITAWMVFVAAHPSIFARRSECIPAQFQYARALAECAHRR